MGYLIGRNGKKINTYASMLIQGKEKENQETEIDNEQTGRANQDPLGIPGQAVPTDGNRDGAEDKRPAEADGRGNPESDDGAGEQNREREDVQNQRGALPRVENISEIPSESVSRVPQQAGSEETASPKHNTPAH